MTKDISSLSNMIEAEKTFNSSQELILMCIDNVFKDCLFTQMKEGDELNIINISEEKNMNLKIIGPAEKGLKLIKEKIKKRRDMLLYLTRRLVQISLCYHQLKVMDLKNHHQKKLSSTLI